MHPLAKRTVREALARGAHLDIIAHHDAIEALDQVARRTSEPAADADALDRPVVVGAGATPARLYTLSLAAHLWIEQADREQWFDGDVLLGNLAVAWALAHAREPACLAAADSARSARKAVRRWATRCTCGVAELVEAARRVAAPRACREDAADDTPENGEPLSHGLVLRLCARLAREFGQGVEYWLFGPHDRVRAAVAVLEAERAAEAAASRGSAPGAPRDPASPDVIAFNRWRKASDAFLSAVCPVETEETASDE